MTDSNRYAVIKEAKQEITKRKELFSIRITASTEQKGEIMESNQQQQTQSQSNPSAAFLVDMVFKPVEPGLKLRNEETQLLLSYLGEILQEIEAEDFVPEEELSL